jgi:transcriptional regulator with XRE-family HTH domain
VRDIRERFGITQHELARAIDVDPSTVHRWEALSRVPRTEAAARLHVFLEALTRAASPAPHGTSSASPDGDAEGERE